MRGIPILLSAGPDRQSGATRAFTLIEVLVVVAIMTLLVAIFVPSLQQARVQAKIAVCKANSKQIADLTATYQSEYRGFVPILFNYFANATNPLEWGAPARICWLSVAFRAYDKSTAKLATIPYSGGGYFAPDIWELLPPSQFESADGIWNNPKRNTYENDIMPDYYTCPFARKKGNGREFRYEDDDFMVWEWRGRKEHYQTWMWPDMIRNGDTPGGKTWPGGPGPSMKGVPQYSAFSWNYMLYATHDEWTGTI
ncbi:MAG: type II secretion system protein, partial [Planctomycetota bacterium]